MLPAEFEQFIGCHAAARPRDDIGDDEEFVFFNFFAYAGAVGNKVAMTQSALGWLDTAGTMEYGVATSKWRTAGAPITSILLLLSTGNFIAGSLFVVQLEP